MANEEDKNFQSNESDVSLCAFALTDCVVRVESQSAKYLRAVHRTALELAVPNLFGFEVGGFWLTPVQLDQLRMLPECYPASEINLARRAVEAYLYAQTHELQRLDVKQTGPIRKTNTEPGAVAPGFVPGCRLRSKHGPS